MTRHNRPPRAIGLGPPPATGRFASPPCYAADVAPWYFDSLAVDPEQARDVARWRAAERARLLAARQSITSAERTAAAAAIIKSLRLILEERRCGSGLAAVSAYWPMRGEPDLRGLMADLHESGIALSLPVVVARGLPLRFRCWSPGARLVRGHWGIPIPAPEAPETTPELMLVPLLGWDGAGYRLGYGGGYFDRTLAACDPAPATIGVGFEAARLATIFPQPHDVPLEIVVTDAGVRVERGRPADHPARR